MATPMEEDPPVIDEDMQSRQMAVYGRESMQKLAKASEELEQIEIMKTREPKLRLDATTVHLRSDIQFI